MKRCLIFGLLLFTLSTYGQETTLITKDGPHYGQTETYEVFRKGPKLKNGRYLQRRSSRDTLVAGFYKNDLKDSLWTEYSYNGSLDHEALRCVKLIPDDWLPAILNGKPVAVTMSQPVVFALN